jgi:hypothetical protein
MRILRAVIALLLWGAGCEAIVGGDLGDVRCAAEGAVGPPACPTAYECRAGLCVPSALGLPCTADTDCAPGDFCLDPQGIGAPGGKACSRACCTSSDCDAEGRFVCFAPPSGAGNVCRPAGELGRAKTGARKAWAACLIDSDCRSGRCLEKRCVDTCCSDTGCAAGGGVCRFGKPTEADTPGFWCAVPLTGKAPRYAACLMDSDCASGLCLDLGVGMRCSAPCCGSETCETLDVSTPVRCSAVVRPGAMVRACSAIVKGSARKGIRERGRRGPVRGGRRLPERHVRRPGRGEAVQRRVLFGRELWRSVLFCVSPR